MRENAMYRKLPARRSVIVEVLSVVCDWGLSDTRPYVAASMLAVRKTGLCRAISMHSLPNPSVVRNREISATVFSRRFRQNLGLR